MEYKKLKNAPIVEAIIEIQFQDSQETIKDYVFENFAKKIAKEFPEQSHIISNEISFTINEKGMNNANPKKTFDGLRIANTDFIIQCTKNRFSLSRVSKYESFASLKAKFLEVWVEFLVDIPKLEISRLAVRCINKFIVPMDGLNDFIKFPNIGFILEEGTLLESNMSRIMTKNDKYNCRGIINFFVNPVFNEEKQSQLEVIFDTDIYRDEIGNIEIDYIDYRLNSLNKYKNALFFDNINSERFE